MIIDPYVGTIAERRAAMARQVLANASYCFAASAAFGGHIPSLLRAAFRLAQPKYIADHLGDDDELMQYATASGGQFYQRGSIVTFARNARLGICDSNDIPAMREGHHPLDLTTGKLLTGWSIP